MWARTLALSAVLFGALSLECLHAARAATTLTHYLKPNEFSSANLFGESVAVAANTPTISTIVVGAQNESSCATGVNGNQSSNGCPSSGSAYVYRCSSSGGCTQQCYLKGSNTAAGDKFGFSVDVTAISANESLIVVGAPFHPRIPPAYLGSAYVFHYSSTSGCTQFAYLKGSNTRPDNYFGSSVAVSANSANVTTVVVGAPRESSCAKGVNGNESDTNCQQAGSAYAFTCDTANCTQFAYLKASNTDARDFFGKSVAVTTNSANESTIVVGANSEDSCASGVDGNETNNGCSRAGSAYVFHCSSAPNCTQVAYLKASETRTNSAFGSGVAISANSATESTVIIMGQSSPYKAFLFRCSDKSTCTPQTQLLLPKYEGIADVALTANSVTESTVVIGTGLGDDSCATGVNGASSCIACTYSGSAYVFRCSSTSGCCTQEAYLKHNATKQNQRLGSAVAVAAHGPHKVTIVAGASGDSSCATGVDMPGTDFTCTNAGSATTYDTTFVNRAPPACPALAPPMAATDSSSGSVDNGTLIGGIVGGVIGFLLLAAIIFAVIWLFFLKRRAKVRDISLSGDSTFSVSDSGSDE